MTTVGDMALSQLVSAQRIKDALDRSGMSQRMLAEYVDMDETALSKALSGRRNFRSLKSRGLPNVSVCEPTSCSPTKSRAMTGLHWGRDFRKKRRNDRLWPTPLARPNSSGGSTACWWMLAIRPKRCHHSLHSAAEMR